MKLPMRIKYIDELQPPLFIFGEHPNGHVDIATANGDVFTDIPRQIALQVEQANKEYMSKLYEILGAQG